MSALMASMQSKRAPCRHPDRFSKGLMHGSTSMRSHQEPNHTGSISGRHDGPPRRRNSHKWNIELRRGVAGNAGRERAYQTFEKEGSDRGQAVALFHEHQGGPMLPLRTAKCPGLVDLWGPERVALVKGKEARGLNQSPPFSEIR